MILSKKHNALVVKTERAPMLASLVPGAALSRQDRETLIVPFHIDNCQLLRKFGLRNVLSPIEVNYDWPGRYTPYAHQRETSAFCTLNKRGYVLNGLGCVDSETEYLTPTGWKRISDYAGEEVAQFNPLTENMSFVKPVAFIKEPCAEMLHVKTKYGLDQMLSSEHRVLLYSKDSPGKTEVITASELYQRGLAWQRGEKHKKSWSSIGFSRAAIGTTFSFSGTGLPFTEAQLRVMVAVKADGHFSRSNTPRVIIRLKKKRKVERLRTLLDIAEIPYKERLQNTPTAKGFHIFTFNSPERSKTYSSWWHASAEQLRIVAEEAIHWDGSVSGMRRTYFSCDKISADFIQFACVASGIAARIHTVDRTGAGAKSVDYEVHYKSGIPLLGIKGSGSEGEKYLNMSVQASPDGYKYCFSVPTGFLVLRRNGCVFTTGNSGKTLSALWAADYLMRMGHIKKCLVLSPLSTLERVWADAIYLDFHNRTAAVLHGTAKRRRKLLADKAYDFYIINHDGFQVVYEELMARKDIDLMIVDEAAVYRSAKTDRWKLLRSFVKNKQPEYIWAMTGTPTPNAPTDAWGLSAMLDTHNNTTFTRFRDMTMRRVSTFTWIPRANATELVASMLSPAVRFATADCIDLPPTIYHTREIELSAAQEKAMKTLVDKYALELDAGTANAVNEADTQNKLIQIACGFIYGRNDEDERIVQKIDPGKRTQVVKEIIDEAEAKVIVFVPYIELLHMVAEELSKHFTCETIYGGTSKRQRDILFHSFQHEKDPKVLVAYPKVMSHGLTLTSAATIVWYAPFPSNDTTEQANARIVRPSQTRTTNIVHIEGSALERKLYKRLQNRQTLQGLLLDHIRDNQ